MAALVTPCRHHAGPTVLDKRRHPNACWPAAGLGGDVGGTDQIPVPTELAGEAAEPAAIWLGDPLMADRTGGGGAPLIHQPHHDAGLLGLVRQGAYPLLDGEGDHLPGRLMVGVVDAGAVVPPPTAA
jgi:hypothetical protein